MSVALSKGEFVEDVRVAARTNRNDSVGSFELASNLLDHYARCEDVISANKVHPTLSAALAVAFRAASSIAAATCLLALASHPPRPP